MSPSVYLSISPQSFIVLVPGQTSCVDFLESSTWNLDLIENKNGMKWNEMKWYSDFPSSLKWKTNIKSYLIVQLYLPTPHRLHSNWKKNRSSFFALFSALLQERTPSSELNSRFWQVLIVQKCKSINKKMRSHQPQMAALVLDTKLDHFGPYQRSFQNKQNTPVYHPEPVVPLNGDGSLLFQIDCSNFWPC